MPDDKVHVSVDVHALVTQEYIRSTHLHTLEQSDDIASKPFANTSPLDKIHPQLLSGTQLPFCKTNPATQTHMDTGTTLDGHNVLRSVNDALPQVRTSVHGFAQPRHS